MSDNRPLALFYGGTNGSGKSTLREKDDDVIIQRHIDADAIARKINPTNPRFVDYAAGHQAMKEYQEAIVHKISFSLETTLSGKGAIELMEKAKSAGFEVELRYIGLKNADLNVARVAARVARGGHHIDEAVIRGRYIRSLEMLPKATVVADRTIIRDNSWRTPIILIIVCRGQMVCLTKTQPLWITNVATKIEEALSIEAKKSEAK